MNFSSKYYWIFLGYHLEQKFQPFVFHFAPNFFIFYISTKQSFHTVLTEVLKRYSLFFRISNFLPFLFPNVFLSYIFLFCKTCFLKNKNGTIFRYISYPCINNLNITVVAILHYFCIYYKCI